MGFLAGLAAAGELVGDGNIAGGQEHRMVLRQGGGCGAGGDGGGGEQGGEG